MIKKLLTICISISLLLCACQEKHTHVFTKVTVPASCTERGYIAKKCDCGEYEIIKFIDPIAHSFGDWVVDKKNRIQTRVCTVCGYTEVGVPYIDEKIEVGTIYF